MLYTAETAQCEVALSSAAIPAPLVLQEAGAHLVATMRIDVRSGAAEVLVQTAQSLMFA